jgi:ferredoxin
MNILQVIVGNLQRDPVTRRFPESVPIPENLRSVVKLDTQLCVGCATCAYVCTSGAIQVTDYRTHYVWDYDPGRCTFCGRCIDYCPSQALSMEAQRPQVYTRAGALRQVHDLTYPLCPECGQPAFPVNDVLLSRAFGEISPEVRAWSRLCRRCRQLGFQPVIVKASYTAGSESNER